MAVYTKINQKEINTINENFNIEEIISFKGIKQGIENTNYLLKSKNKKYILTIFEKRVKDEDLPFFINLKLYLNEKNFKCPQPIKNKKGEIINSLKNKKAIIISFIDGSKINTPTRNQCKEVGKMVGNLHNLTIDFNQKRDNSLGIEEWKNILNKCENNNSKFDRLIFDLKNELEFLENSLPTDLPSGIIHADLFKDNIFFKEENCVGVIDFYFSCYHFFLYDIAIVINDWCFTENGKVFKYELFNSIIEGYKSKRNLENEEVKAFNIILRAATVRILVTRLHDFIFHPEDAVVIKKDPYQYYNILKWHQNSKEINT